MMSKNATTMAVCPHCINPRLVGGTKYCSMMFSIFPTFCDDAELDASADAVNIGVIEPGVDIKIRLVYCTAIFVYGKIHIKKPRPLLYASCNHGRLEY